MDVTAPSYLGGLLTSRCYRVASQYATSLIKFYEMNK